MLLNVMAHQLEKKQITIQLIEHDTNISIQGERELLGIALSEILDNAIRYTAEHGNITINYMNEDNHTVITIEDTGIGMTDHTRQRIFERFFRADEAHSTTGFGLGLSIAKRIIELHGGEIEVGSEVGTGSIIRLRLPRMMQAEPTTSA